MLLKIVGFLSFATIFISTSVNAQDNKLILAAKLDDVPKLISFLNQDLDPNVGDPIRGETALMWAIREDAIHAINFLSHHPKININARAKNGDSALMIACYMGKKEIIQNLILRKANVNQEGWTALHYAVVTGNEEIAAFLLKNEASINALSPNGTTPLMLATRSGNLKLIEMLIQHGADIKFKNAQGMSAYDFAIQAEMRSIAQYLEELQK